jgi:tetratricopeptide (TPR) repeat protein
LICIAAGACSSSTPSDPPKVSDPKASEPKAPPVAAKPPVDDRYDAESLGAITFALSEGKPDAQAHFMRGLLALHSFWYDEASRQFQAAITADPTMNMAYWGAAMSYCKLLWGDDDVAAARAVLKRMPDPDRLSEREQAWVVAAVRLVTGDDVRASRQRFLAEMEQLHASFPDDESATFLALALLSTIRPEDSDTTALRKRAAGLASDVFKHNPKHPGAAHYLIHAYDTPELASLALPFARDYARIAPAAFHARHMPAHIFSRLGMWKEAITSCRSAWDASVASARREKLSADHHDFHSLNWLVEMNFEVGRRKDADAALAMFADAVRGGLDHQQRALYASQVASYMVRTGDWMRVDELLAPLDTPAVEDRQEGRAGGSATHCAPAPASSPTLLLEQKSILDARVRAAAMQHDAAKTEKLIAELDANGQKLRPFLLGTQPKEQVAKIDEIEARRRVALHARARSNDRALLKVLRESAAEPEPSGETNPSGFLVHEEIAETLMRLGQPKDAAAEYALALAKHPGRARSLLGAARANAKAGDPKAARARYEKLLELWSAPDEGTDGLIEARAAVAASN